MTANADGFQLPFEKAVEGLLGVDPKKLPPKKKAERTAPKKVAGKKKLKD